MMLLFDQQKYKNVCCGLLLQVGEEESDLHSLLHIAHRIATDYNVQERQPEEGKDGGRGPAPNTRTLSFILSC